MENKNELTLERVVDAPAETVWKAWTEPEKLEQWWGPNNIIIPECKVDLRVGGAFYIVMEADAGMGQYKGTRWPMQAEFTAIVPQAKLSYNGKAWTEGQSKEDTTIDQTTEVTFAEEGDKTRVTIHVVVHNPETAPKMAIEGMQGGFTQQLDKLNTFVIAQK